MSVDDLLMQVYTAGGGAANQVWSDMRQQMLGVPVIRSPADEAAYGAALLASQAKVNPLQAANTFERR